MASQYLNDFRNLTWVPTCYYDGGQELLIGGYADQSYYTSRINTCAQREVPDIDLSVEVIYINGTTIDVIVSLTNNHFVNLAPQDPSQPAGIDQGLTGREYSFTSSSTDPEGNMIYYKWDWGDGHTSDWLGPYNSGEVVQASHIWNDHGTHNISVMVKDEYDEESGWSPITPVQIAVLGDATGNGICDGNDAVFLIYYIFRGGPAPDPLISANVNCGNRIDIADIVYIIRYAFQGGPPPGCN